MRRGSGVIGPGWARSLQFPDFRLLWLCVLLQSAAVGMNWVVTGWLVFELTGSAFVTAAASAISMVPFFFLGAVTGAVADRMNRSRLLRIVTVAAAVTSGVMAAALLADLARLWHILALTALNGCATAFLMTTRQSLTYDIVGAKLALNGMSLNSVSMQVGLVCGSLLSGIIISAIGAGGQFLVIGLVYLASGGFALFIRAAAGTREHPPQSVVRVLAEYVGIMRRNRILVTLMLLTGINELFGFTHMSLLPVLAKEVLGLGAVGLGVLTGVRQVGGIAGQVGLAALGNFRRKGMLMFAVMAAFGVCLMALVLVTDVVYYVAVLSLATACAMCVDTLHMTLMQENVAEHERGRAMGAWTLSIGVAPVGHLGLGALAGAIGAPWALFVSGTVLLGASAATAAGLPRIRRLP